MTGSELMSGDTIDSNSAFLGHVFNEFGIEVLEKVTVGDDEQLLLKQLNRLAGTYDVIFMNGGLGPTHDDLTAQVLATAAKLATQMQNDMCCNGAKPAVWMLTPPTLSKLIYLPAP